MKNNETMEKKPSAFKGVDTLFETAADPKKERDGKAAAEKKDDELALVSSQALHAFPDHPYTVDASDDDMAKLVDSIQREGLLERIVVRRRREGGFEILSGHRRARACAILGISEVPVIIKHGLSDDAAVLLMVDANLKRENILPMDEAKALKMQMDAMNRMGQRSAHGKVKRTDEQIAEKINKNRMYVQRKVKLLDLTPSLQKVINDRTLSETPAFEIAFLPAKVQDMFYDWMQKEDRKPTVAQAIGLRQHQQELAKSAVKGGKDNGKILTEEQIDRIMNGERLAEIFPPPESEKNEQSEKGGPVSAPAPIAGADKDTDTPGKAGVTDALAAGAVVPPKGETGKEQQPAAADSKMIPFQPQAAQPQAPGGGAAPAPAAPAQAAQAVPAPASQQPTVDATKSYIRTEYMAELRKDNVILPKNELKGLVPRCDTNSEYVAAIRAALEQRREKQQDAKAVESKAPSFPPPTPGPKPKEPMKTDAPAPVSAAIPTPKPPESPKSDKAPFTPPLAPVVKPAEPLKTDTSAAPSKPPEPPKTDKPPFAPPVAPATKSAAPLKVNAAPVSAAVPTPKPAEPKMPEKPSPIPSAKPNPAQNDEGTKALDDYLKNKARPGKPKTPQEKSPDKPR